jgi:hypothetical protein
MKCGILLGISLTHLEYYAQEDGHENYINQCLNSVFQFMSVHRHISGICEQ